MWWWWRQQAAAVWWFSSGPPPRRHHAATGPTTERGGSPSCGFCRTPPRTATAVLGGLVAARGDWVVRPTWAGRPALLLGRPFQLGQQVLEVLDLPERGGHVVRVRPTAGRHGILKVG